ncbi:hypothetical protein Tco_1316286 [Tanacetum coccineum]
MEQGFLNRSNKASLKKDGTNGPLLSDLAKRVKNINGKILGRDGKPLLPYRCVKGKVSPSVSVDDVDVVKVNTKDDCEVGCSNSASIDSVNNHGAADVPSESSNIPTIDVGSEVMGVNIPAAKEDVVDLSLADVIIPQEKLDTLSTRLENSLYGYFVGQRPAFPVVQNYVQNVWRKYGFMHVMVHQGSVPLILNVWNPNSVLKKEDIKKVPVWVKMFNVHVVAYLKGMNSYARALVEISADNDFVEYLVVAVPVAKTKGHRLVFHYIRERVDIRKLGMDDGFMHGKRKSKGVNQVSKVRLRLPKGKPKLIYRPVSKPTNNQVGTSKPNDSSPPNSKEDVNLACEKPSVSSNVTNDDSTGPTTANTALKYIQDDINMGQLRSFLEKRMEEDKVFEINNDIVVSATISNAPTGEYGNEKGSLLEQFLKSREASKDKHHSLSDSDEFEVEEVCIPDPIPGGGFLDGLEADLDGYDRYETPVYDLNEQEKSFCDQYDIRLNSHRRKSFI